MFYLDSTQNDKILRFGDVIQDIPICFTVIKSPEEKTYHIQVSPPTYSVVLSPCCSIDNKVISVTPLLHLLPSIFMNPFFVENPTRINETISAQNSVPPKAWDDMTESEKLNRLSKGPSYAFVEYFTYDSHPLFQQYIINRKEGNISTSFYMIDFRKTVRIDCEKITRHYSPGTVKILQLTIETRDLLRKKIGSFYQRIPQEDIDILA